MHNNSLSSVGCVGHAGDQRYKCFVDSIDALVALEVEEGQLLDDPILFCDWHLDTN